MAEQPVTDLSYLRDLAMGDDSIIIETAEAFCDNTPETVDKIESHYKNNEWQELYKQAHKIKPNLKYMGMEQAVELILNIEEQAKTENISDDLGMQISELCALCRQAFDELADKIEGLKE